MPKIVPMTVKAAQRAVKQWHRHLPRVQGGLFACGVAEAGELVGVGIAGNPCQEWQGTGRICITRVAISEGVRNACSMVYGALAGAAKRLGYDEAWTYTLPEEPGTSLRAAGFEDMGITYGGEYDRPSRRRAPAVHPEPKRRWRRRLSMNDARERETQAAAESSHGSKVTSGTGLPRDPENPEPAAQAKLGDESSSLARVLP